MDMGSRYRVLPGFVLQSWSTVSVWAVKMSKGQTWAEEIGLLTGHRKKRFSSDWSGAQRSRTDQTCAILTRCGQQRWPVSSQYLNVFSACPAVTHRYSLCPSLQHLYYPCLSQYAISIAHFQSGHHLFCPCPVSTPLLPK